MKMQEENERKYIHDVGERRRESSYTVCVRPFAISQKMPVSSRNFRTQCTVISLISTIRRLFRLCNSVFFIGI